MAQLIQSCTDNNLTGNLFALDQNYLILHRCCHYYLNYLRERKKKEIGREMKILVIGLAGRKRRILNIYQLKLIYIPFD